MLVESRHRSTILKAASTGAINVLVDITERAENERRLDLATKVGNLGIWDWDIIGDEITWTDAVYAIHGMEKGSSFPP